ncbi:MAG: DUF6209 family protein, partial [Polyangiaceae bacterium]
MTGCALAGCSAPAEDDASSTASQHLTGKAVTISFNGDFTTTTSAPLMVGDTVTVSYDTSRLTTCRGNANGGGPGWTIGASYQTNGGAVSSIVVAGLNPDPSAKPTFTLTTAGDLAFWFENNSLWGCDAYDSAYGQNYHLNVLASANAPGWIGDAQYVISRATCSGDPCASDFHPLDGGFTYDTWSRERAAIRRGYFEVWKSGVTDFDNADLWKELDVEVHSRVGGSGAFASHYVSFDERDGNNARYAVDLTTLDPLPGGPGGSAISNKADCPQFPVSYEGPAGAD